MSGERLEEAIFTAASELDNPEAREDFLRRACGGDQDLKDRVEALLRAGHDADSFFHADPLKLNAQEAAPREEAADASGERIGRYKLLQKIGEGGMGVVYMAEQHEPVRRKVALKIIKLGMDTRSVVARFEAERQALALMDHPNIARILDGGATEMGRPYFVMELVPGVAITEYCDKNRLSIAARIQLFLKVCDAVQSAHQKGIIHRDLKPSNILVTLHDGVPVPKVIDFGVAKATNQELTAKTLFTNYATLIGTPAYMSPEQAEMSGLDVDTRSDIYSLGVLLYELLTGTTPFPEKRLREAGYGEMQRIISQEEPQRLRTRISTMEGNTQSVVAKNRSVEAVALGRRLKDDLDAIVMKCLEKDRTRRYESASGIAADLRRHLHNEPVLARPASAAYRARKFIRRNKAGVAVGATVLFAILAALVVAAFSYRQTQLAALRAARFQYASDMNLARVAADEGNFFRALQILDRHRPKGSAPDLRGWEWRNLLRECRSEELATLGWHTNEVLTVSFAPDGNTAVSGGADRLLRIWNVETRRQAAAIEHDDSVVGAQFSPDGQWLALAFNSKLHILEWPSQKVRHQFTNGWFRGNSMTFSADSKRFAFARYNDGYSLVDLKHGEETPVFKSEHGWLAPMGLAFSPDLRSLALSSGEGEIIFWDIASRAVERRWTAHDWYITRIFFSANGRQLYSGSADRTVKVWDIATERELRRITSPLGFGASRVASAAVSRDGRFLASTTKGAGVAITINEMPEGREVRTFRGNKDMVSDLAFSPDGNLLISGSYDGSVRLWDITSKPEEADFRAFPSDYPRPGGPRAGYCLSPDGRHLACYYTNGTFSVRQLPSMVESPRRVAPVTNIVAIGVANGGGTLAFVGEKGETVLWRADAGAASTLTLPVITNANRATFSEDAKYLAVGGSVVFAVCELETQRTTTFTNDKPSALFKLSFMPGAEKVMSSYWDGQARIWTLLEPERPPLVFKNDQQVNGMVMLPGGKTLVTVAREIVFWDVETGARQFVLVPRSALFRGLALSPDGSRLAAGAADGMITIWDMASMQEVATLKGHDRPILDIRFLGDGDTLVTVAVNGVRVWRATPREEIARAVEN